MKKFVAFNISNSVQAQDIIKHIEKPESVFRDFQSPTEIQTGGFVAIYTDDLKQDFTYVLTDNVLFIRYRLVSKQLPRPYIKEQTKKRVAEIEARETRKMGKREIRNIEESVIAELLPRAFTKTEDFDFYFDFNKSKMYIGNTSEKKVELMIKQVLSEDYQLNPTPIHFEKPFGSTIKERLVSGWFAESETELNTNSECVIELSGDGEQKPKIHIKDLSMCSDDVKENIEKDNRFVSSISLSFGDNISFTVNDRLQFSSVKNDLIKSKFNENEESIKEFYENNLILDINGINDILIEMEKLLG